MITFKAGLHPHLCIIGHGMLLERLTLMSALTSVDHDDIRCSLWSYGCQYFMFFHHISTVRSFIRFLDWSP